MRFDDVKSSRLPLQYFVSNFCVTLYIHGILGVLKLLADYAFMNFAIAQKALSGPCTLDETEVPPLQLLPLQSLSSRNPYQAGDSYGVCWPEPNLFLVLIFVSQEHCCPMITVSGRANSVKSTYFT